MPEIDVEAIASPADRLSDLIEMGLEDLSALTTDPPLPLLRAKDL